MYVCICFAVTTADVQVVIDRGARTTKQVAARCAAGTSCGKCCRLIRRMIDDSPEPAPAIIAQDRPVEEGRG